MLSFNYLCHVLDFITLIFRIPTNVPSACARFSHELFYSPEIVLRLKFKNLVHISDLDGGHFAALEVPELLAKDIYEATDKFLKFQRK